MLKYQSRRMRRIREEDVALIDASSRALTLPFSRLEGQESMWTSPCNSTGTGRRRRKSDDAWPCSARATGIEVRVESVPPPPPREDSGGARHLCARARSGGDDLVQDVCSGSPCGGCPRLRGRAFGGWLARRRAIGRRTIIGAAGGFGSCAILSGSVVPRPEVWPSWEYDQRLRKATASAGSEL